jgi:hypothetical protein
MLKIKLLISRRHRSTGNSVKEGLITGTGNKLYLRAHTEWAKAAVFLKYYRLSIGLAVFKGFRKQLYHIKTKN